MCEDALALSGDIIDIKKKTVNVHSSEIVEVSILSREGVDATTIDPLSVTLRGLPPGAEWVLPVRRGDDCKVQGREQGRPAGPRLQVRFSEGHAEDPRKPEGRADGDDLRRSYDFHGSDTILFK